MATIDDVMDKLGDVLDKIADVKEKCDEILSKDDLYMKCDACDENGKIPQAAVDANGLPTTPILVNCPYCNGSKLIKCGGIKSE